jgi:hypothetical protein
LRLKAVGIAAGIVISTAAAAESAAIAGSRTGHATKYSEHSLGVTWWPDKIITLRPELRFDHSYDMATFDNGARRNQLVGSMDVIIHY